MDTNGVDKMIKTKGSRTRLNIVDAIRLGHLSETLTAQYKTVNSDSIMDFLSKSKRFMQIRTKLT
jgi:uncharacterized protein (DUF433 family)